MTPEQLHQIDQARRYAEQDEYVVTRTHIRNLLAIIEGRPAPYSEEKERAAFEKWHIEFGDYAEIYGYRFYKGGYCHGETQRDWAAWVARAQLESS